MEKLVFIPSVTAEISTLYVPAEDVLLEILLRRYLIHWYDAQIGYDRKLVDDTIYEAHCEDVKRMIKRYPICHRMFRDILVDYSSPHAMRILDPIFQQEPESSGQ